MADKERYLLRLKDRLNSFYLQVRDYDNKDMSLYQSIEAFMEAGLILGAVNKPELEKIISDEHVSIFGISRQERMQKAKDEALLKGNFAFFDTPTWQRHQP